jgi:hypothetical protein
MRRLSLNFEVQKRGARRRISSHNNKSVKTHGQEVVMNS